MLSGRPEFCDTKVRGNQIVFFEYGMASRETAKKWLSPLSGKFEARNIEQPPSVLYDCSFFGTESELKSSVLLSLWEERLPWFGLWSSGEPRKVGLSNQSVGRQVLLGDQFLNRPPEGPFSSVTCGNWGSGAVFYALWKSWVTAFKNIPARPIQLLLLLCRLLL